jgi:hypothetical protein
MPRAEILSRQAVHTLTQLHAELAGKIETNRKSGDRLRAQMMQVEAVMKMLDPEVNLRLIAPKRRNTGNPWFKRGTLYSAVVDTLRRATGPMTSPTGWQDASGHPEAGEQPAGGHTGGAAGAKERRGNWRGFAASVAAERGRRLKLPWGIASDLGVR